MTIMRYQYALTLLLCNAIGCVLHAADIPVGSVRDQDDAALSLRPPRGLPGSLSEMRNATKEIPGLANIGRNAFFSVEQGKQVILLGDKIPIAPGPHIPWAKPYRKKLKILSFIMTNGPGDASELAQICRELDCDMRFVSIISETITGGEEWGKDEAYRLGFLAKQARESLLEDYDVILLSIGSYSPGYGKFMYRPIFPDDIYEAILTKVRNGTGLVMVGSSLRNTKEKPWLNCTPLKDCAPALMTGGHRIVDRPVFTLPQGSDVFAGMPLDGFPKMAIWDWKPANDASVLLHEGKEPIVIERSFGNGRTLALGWDGTIAPVKTLLKAKSTTTALQREHGMALTLRAILQAAACKPDAIVTVPAAEIEAGVASTVVIHSSCECSLECMVHDDDLKVLHADKIECVNNRGTVTLPPLCAGAYAMDVIARDRNGNSLGWGSGRLRVTARQSISVTTDREIYKKDDAVKIAGEVKGAESDAEIRVKVTDAVGRLLFRSDCRAVNGRFSSEYKIHDFKTAPHTVMATLLQNKIEIVRGGTQFFVPDFGWHDYQNLLWYANPAEELTAYFRDSCGITGVMEGYQRDGASMLGSQIGIKHSRINDAGLDVAEVQLKAPKPSEYQMAEFNKTLEICKRYGCLSFCFQDERHCSSDPGMPQPAAIQEFRAYLNRQYGSLAKLNASWDKNYQSWDDVIPVLTKDLTPNTKNIAPWVDLRLFVADRCFEIDKYKSDKLREAFGKDFAVGLDGFVACPLVIPYGGLDIGRLLAEGVFNHYCPYEQDHLIASMVTSKMVKFIGWGMSKDEYMGNPWRDLFRGHWGTYRFQGMTYVSPFGWFNPAAFWIEEGTREIRGGIGKLLMGAKRQFTPIAILYSYPSMMTTAGAGVWVEKGNPHLMWHPAERSRDAFDRMLLKCGNGAFKYVTDKQAANGHLKGTKLLIIPHFMGIALDDNTCNAIKEFVADGGYVVADMAPAVCDEHGKLREKGGLDDLFGVTRSSFAYVQRASDYLVGVTQPDPLVPANAWFVGEWYEKNLKVTDGQALGMHVFEKIPAFVVKNTGKGRTLLLNFLNSSTVRRNGEPETEDIDLMQSILKTAGVRGDVSGPSGCEVNVFRDGNAEYVGVYPYCGNSQSLPGDMQMALGITGETTNAGTKEGMISFKDNRDTYDVRQGKYLGRIQKTQIPNRLNAALFARLDYKIEDIHITAESAQAGEAVRIHVSLNTSAAPGRHVVHLEIIEPNGKRSFLYSENMEIYNGNAEKVVHTALNDPRGAWKIMAREVVSGKTAETSFQLK